MSTSSVCLLLHTPHCPDLNLVLEIAPDGALKAATARVVSASASDVIPPLDDLIHDAVEGHSPLDAHLPRASSHDALQATVFPG
jgi:hypothetical protein